MEKPITKKEEFENLIIEIIKNPKVVLFEINPKIYRKFLIFLSKILISKLNFSGIYITLNYPYSYLIKILKEEDIDIKKIYFIDCVSQMQYAPKGILITPFEVQSNEEAIFIKSPSNLSEFVLIVYELLSSVKEPRKKFIFIDSLNILFLYNDEKNVLKFLHFLTSRLKIFGFVGFAVVLEKDKKTEMFYEFFDEVINIEDLK